MKVAILAISVVAGGAIMLFIARWARKKNFSLEEEETDKSIHGNGISWLHIFFGKLSIFESYVGYALAIVAILISLVFVAILLYMVIAIA